MNMARMKIKKMKIRETTKTLNGFIHGYLIWLIILSYLLASILPEPGLILREVHFTNPMSNNQKIPLSLVLLSLILFNAGIGVKIYDLSDIKKDIWILIVGVISNVTVPLTFISLITLLSG